MPGFVSLREWRLEFDLLLSLVYLCSIEQRGKLSGIKLLHFLMRYRLLLRGYVQYGSVIHFYQNS